VEWRPTIRDSSSSPRRSRVSSLAVWESKWISSQAGSRPLKISPLAPSSVAVTVVAALLSAHTQRNMASFAEAPAGDVAKGTSRHARTRGASTRPLDRRARHPRSFSSSPSVPILNVCFRRREDLQDQVRAVPRRRGRRRPQAGTSRRDANRNRPRADRRPPRARDRPPIPRREKPHRPIARQRGRLPPAGARLDDSVTPA